MSLVLLKIALACITVSSCQIQACQPHTQCLQAFISLLATSNSVGALLSACGQLKRCQASIASALLAGTDSARLQHLVQQVWQAVMQQLQHRFMCLNCSLLSAKRLCQELLGADQATAPHTVRQQCTALAHKLCDGNVAAAESLGAGMRRRLVRECSQSSDILAAAASALLNAAHRVAKLLHGGPWQGLAADSDESQLAGMQATIMAMLAQCALLHSLLLCSSGEQALLCTDARCSIVRSMQRPVIGHMCACYDEDVIAPANMMTHGAGCTAFLAIMRNHAALQSSTACHRAQSLHAQPV